MEDVAVKLQEVKDRSLRNEGRIKQPVMRRDPERAGTEIYVLPQYKLTYDENGYCVKKEKCHIPEEIAAKLMELNK